MRPSSRLLSSPLPLRSRPLPSRSRRHVLLQFAENEQPKWVSLEDNYYRDERRVQRCEGEPRYGGASAGEVPGDSAAGNRHSAHREPVDGEPGGLPHGTDGVHQPALQHNDLAGRGRLNLQHRGVLASVAVSQLEHCGLKQAIEIDKIPRPSIIARIAGGDPGMPLVVLGAHLDSLGGSARQARKTLVRRRGRRLRLRPGRVSAYNTAASIAFAAGHCDLTVSQFAHSGLSFAQPSVIAKIADSEPGPPVVILGARIDSINNAGEDAHAPGTDNDGSGSVTLLEVYRALQQNRYAPRVLLELHCYAGEEGGLLGSGQRTRDGGVQRMMPRIVRLVGQERAFRL